MAGLYLQVEVLELDDDRLIEAGMEGRGAYLTVGLLAKRTETDGWVTMAQLRKEGVTADMVSDLFGWGLVDDSDGRVRQVGWLDRNPSQAAIDQRRQSKADAGKRGNHDRWNHPEPFDSCSKCHVVALCDPIGVAPPNRVGSPDTESESDTKSKSEASTPGSKSQTEEPPAEAVAAEPPPEVDVAQEVNRAVRLYSQTKASQEVRANGGDVDRLAAAIGKAALTDGRAEDLRQLVESGMTAEDAAAARADGLFGITSTATPQTVSDEELQAQRDQQESKRLAMLAADEAERDAPRGDHATGLAEARAARRAVVSGAHQ